MANCLCLKINILRDVWALVLIQKCVIFNRIKYDGQIDMHLSNMSMFPFLIEICKIPVKYVIKNGDSFAGLINKMSKL